MGHRFKIACAALVACGLSCAVADAAPAASCAKNFVGTWRHHGMFGITNTITFAASGAAICTDNASCVQGTWTCEGSALTYNNGMFNTVYTLAPDGMRMTAGGNTVVRLGAAPRGAAAREPAQTFRTDPFTNETPTSRADAIRLANGYVNAARAAEQYCSYADQMKANENYTTAARFFAQAGDAAAEARAKRAASLASGRADHCDKPVSARAAPARRGPAASQPASPPANAECGAQITNIRGLAAAGREHMAQAKAFRLIAAGMGCAVPTFPGEQTPFRVTQRDCLRAKLTLGGKMTHDELSAALNRAGCR